MKNCASLTSAGLRGVARRSAFVLLAGSIVMLAGCRSYGRYDAKEKMLPEMRQSVQQFTSDLKRARANLDLLQQAAADDSTLRVVADEYDRAVARHEEMLNENQQILSRFQQDDLPSYRDVHRIFGAMLSEHQAARNRYRSLIKAVRYPGITQRLEARADTGQAGMRRSLPDTLLHARDETFTEGRYYVAPIFYERMQSAGSDMTMRQALAERQQRRTQAGRFGQEQQEGVRLPSAASPDTGAASAPQRPTGAPN